MKKKKQGFTLVELMAVIVILSIILAIAVPSITGIFRKASINAFESSAKLILKAADYKKLESTDFDSIKLNVNNINEYLGLSNDNYESVSITI